MKRVRRQFVLSAMGAIFVLLTVLLAILNGINFTMVAADGDRITQKIAAWGDAGAERGAAPPEGGRLGRMERMGPDSPELPYTARYFTYRFTADGAAEEIAFRVAALSREEALALARSVSGESGWVGGVYRYRVWSAGDSRMVTVVDLGRELLPSWRILIISAVGELVGLLVCFAFLVFVSRRLFAPLEEADRKQRMFLVEAENEMKIPLTVIHAAAERIEKENGPSEAAQSIRRQIRKMTSLTERLGSLSLIEAGELERGMCELSHVAAAAADAAAPGLSAAGIALTRQIEDGVRIEGDADALGRVADELLENCRKFARSRASISLARSGGHVVLAASNDTELETGELPQVFDRFTRLENAAGKDGCGLGLAEVKEIVHAHNGRLEAAAADGEFTVRVIL